MNEKVQTTTKNADGVTVTVVADSFSALTTVVNLKKVDKKKGFNNA